MSVSSSYQTERSHLRTGDVVAFSGRAFVGFLIRMMTCSSWSHVGIVLKINGRVFIVESKEGKGVVLTPLSNALPVALLMQNDSAIRPNATALLAEVGKTPYSYLNAIRGWLGKPLRGNGKQCAQFVAQYTDLQDLPAMTPQTVVAELLKRGYTLKYLNTFNGEEKP